MSAISRLRSWVRSPTRCGITPIALNRAVSLSTSAAPTRATKSTPAPNGASHAADWLPIHQAEPQSTRAVGAARQRPFRPHDDVRHHVANHEDARSEARRAGVSVGDWCDGRYASLGRTSMAESVMAIWAIREILCKVRHVLLCRSSFSRTQARRVGRRSGRGAHSLGADLPDAESRSHS